MTADQRNLLQRWASQARINAGDARLPVGPMVDAVEAALNAIDCYEAMKEGVGIRIADLEVENQRLRQQIENGKDQYES